VIASKEYWSPASVERSGLSALVGQGFQALEEAERSGSSTVFVRAYQRRQDGKTVQVSAHRRGAPPRGEVFTFDADALAKRDGDARSLLDVQWFLPKPPGLLARPPVTPRPGTPMERVPRQSGAEGAKDAPSWARGDPRRVGETPTQFAERLMDARYGGRNNWDFGKNSRGGRSEFSQIYKSARGWRDPRGIATPPEA
jgi:hypothetical protein